MKTPRYTDGPARFEHVNLYKTDIAKTFARIRRQQREAAQIAQARQEQAAREARTKVQPITRRKA